jgi:translation initiation factor 4E
MTSLAESKESVFGDVAIANPQFHLKKDGKTQTKKTPDFSDVAVWTSGSSEEWYAGIEDGTAGRRSKKVCYMNKGAWVEQVVDMHTVVPGAFYTIRVDATRSAEKADKVLVQLYLGDKEVHSESVGELQNMWKEFRTLWQAPSNTAPGQHLRLRLTMNNQWGQIDNVRVHCGETATALDDAMAAAADEQAKIEAAAADFEKDGTPLNSGWSIWEHRKQGNKMTSDAAYLSGIARVADFRTVQGFWQYWNQLPLPSEFFTNQKGQKRTFEDRALEGLSVFREGIAPTWEDAMNADGGEFFIRSSGSQLSVQQLDEFWEQTVLGMIGETVDPGCEVCGARVVDKSKHKGPAYRLELWFRRNDSKIGDEMKQRLTRCLAEVNNGRAPKLDYRNHKF